MFGKIRDILGARGQEPAQSPQDAGPVTLPIIEPFSSSTVETAPHQIRLPDTIKGNVDHGGHFRALAKNDQEATKLCIDALAASRHKKMVMYGSDEISGYLWGDSLLQVLTLTKNGQTVTAYPVFKVGSPWLARLTRTTERENGLEGQIEAFANGGSLTFFDALYFQHKHAYFPGRDVKVVVSGIAYVLARSRGRVGRTKAHGEDDLLVRYEGGDVDDYVFRGTALGSTDFMLQDKRARAIKTTLRLGHEGRPLDFYVCATSNALQEKVSPGDHISGIIWLQGFVVSM